MLHINVTTAKGKCRTHRLDCGSWIIGRGLTCDIRISDRSVARQHAILDVFPDRHKLRSVTPDVPFRVDGEVATAYGPLRSGDRIGFGDSRIDVVEAAAGQGVARNRREEGDGLPVPLATRSTGESTTNPSGDLSAEAVSSLQATPDNALEADLVAREHGTTALAGRLERADKAFENDLAAQRYGELTPLRRAVQEQVQAQLDLHRRDLIGSMNAAELRAEVTGMAERVMAQNIVEVPPDVDRRELIEQVVAESIGLGPIEPLLDDDGISEVMINGPRHVYVERGGRLQRVGVRFLDERSLMCAIERIVTPLGRRIDEGVPMVDARLPDGSRVNAIIRPLSLTGPVVTIRKFAKQRFDMHKLVELGSLSPQMAEFLLFCVAQRRNIVISGGTGSGKTTFLNALSDAIPEHERIVTIEDAAELRLAQEHVISLEARPANIEGRGQVAIRDLVRNALRMRPDRIVVGECRGGEALDMLQAMNTGHDGSLTTGHANSPRDLLSRLEVMVLMSGMDLPVRAIREQIASAVDIVVQQMRFRDGRRRVTAIVEVDGMEGDVVLLQKLFEFQQSGVGADGLVVGDFVGLGQAPHFYSELESAGVHVDRALFNSRWSPAAAPVDEE